MNKTTLLSLIMALRVVPNLLLADDDAANPTLIIPGAAVGGADVALTTPAGGAQLTAKRTGTLLDDGDLLDGLKGAGSVLLAQSFGLNTAMLSSEYTLNNTVPTMVMVNVPMDGPISGVKFILTTTAVYTAAANNFVGLYSYDPATGDLTRIAISADNANLYTDGANTLHAEPFAAAVSVAAGTYFAAFSFNISGFTTLPAIAAAPQILTLAGVAGRIDLPNNGRTYGVFTGTSTLPTSINMSAVAVSTARPWVALY